MISNRLKSLVKYIDDIDNIIDIGCDHALLDIYLINHGITNELIVSDIHESALKAGIDNIKKARLTCKIDARLGDGLEVLEEKDYVDTILISGMGTNTILNILKHDYMKNITKLILQSNNDHTLLRTEVVKLGFYIDAEEYFVDNNKNYINIVFKKGKRKYNKYELKYGPYLLKNKEYLEFEIANCNKIINLLPDNHKIGKLKLNKEIKFLNKQLKKI